MQKSRKIYGSVPLTLFAAAMCQRNFLIWGRGTAKTEGATVLFHLKNITHMPTSVNAMCGPSMEHMLKVELPGFLRGLARHGYVDGVNMMVRKRPPKKWKWTKPSREPEDPSTCIFFPNGSVIQLFGLNFQINNGMSVDSASYQEARFIKAESAKEMSLTIRGNRELFDGQSCHHSLLMTTDMPASPASKWILDIASETYEKNKDNQANVQGVFEYQRDLQRYLNELATFNRPEKIKQLEYKINAKRKEINILRTDTTYVSYASTLDNAKVLGLSVIKNFANNLTPAEWDRSVLNKKNSDKTNLFYPAFNEELHTYIASDNNHVASLEYSAHEPMEENSQWDMDCNHHQPLDISIDWNNAILPMAIGQMKASEYKIINNIYVMAPKFISDLAKSFDRYYRYKKQHNNEVHFYYDSTAVARNPKDGTTYMSEFVSTLNSLGWKVLRKPIGQLQSQEQRFRMYMSIFKGESEHKYGIPPISFNLHRCKWLIESISQCEAIPTEKGFKKDKRPEKNKALDQRTTPHGSDAVDQLVCGRFASRYTESYSTGSYATYLG